ncbi:RNA polymerase sigma factor [Longispora fulva]|uniref:RNA polymerase sigma factor n=1 Tax=Longispora fulva TaxID=619741 RepID=A0A8J7GP17_9ACTN|nr:sigma-70 family RNA polymerase sigma factor [Longispora fulva]MBG6140603.1 RNA polymerase sigma-70 factor (ECF subfamily) [Longispora fulva]GIG57015.1 RNA polymerase sigma factor [Longispora fulva]
MNPAPDSATQWALAARDGDPVAQAALVRETQSDVWRLCASLADARVADDLTQETYLRAFKALARFEARSTVRTWLLGIARRVCVDHIRVMIRQRRADNAFEEPAYQPDPAAGVSGEDLLRRLPADRRSAFVLTQVLGLSYAEAADIESVPIGTIRSRVARARADLVEAVETALTS